MSPAEETEMPESIARVLAMDDEARRSRQRPRRGRSPPRSRRLAEHHVAVARSGACVAGAVGPLCSDDQVVEAVAVDVAGRGDRSAGEVIDFLAMDDEADRTARERGEVDLGRKGTGLAEHHIAVAGRGACVAGAIAALCPDDQVVEAVAVDVAAEDTEPTGYIAAILAMDDEAAVAGRDRGEVDLGRKAGGLAEHHIAVAREDAGVAGAIAVGSPDDEVVEAVAVDVAGRGDRIAGVIARVLAMDDEAPVAGRDRGEVDLGGKPRALPNTT